MRSPPVNADHRGQSTPKPPLPSSMLDVESAVRLTVSFVVMATSSATAFSLTSAFRDSMKMAFEGYSKKHRVLSAWLPPIIFLIISLCTVFMTGYYVDGGVRHYSEIGARGSA